jgi:serine/threonine protein kinase
MINSIIGKYKVTRLIGEGGMASVYEAEHEMLGTKVAIKVLNPILSANAQIKERFRNEAKLMASLDHPNITKVIDFDEQSQQLSIVMEFLNGEDLNQKIKSNGPLSEREITDIFTHSLSAFQYAHEKGIVHRDIKPSNIFILPNGHVKILDFGIAKLFGQGNEMTQTGTQMGTPIYMSPEQVKADKSIDHRSDIYSLGVTMFFAINGKPPYNSDKDSQFDIFTKIVYEPLPDVSIDSKFNEIILKACQKNREDRFQSCSEWLAFLNIRDSKNFYQNDFEKKNTDEILPTIVNDPKSSWFSNKNFIIGAIILFVIAFIVFIFSNQTKGIIDNTKRLKYLEITEKNKKDQVETAIIAKKKLKKEKVEKEKITSVKVEQDKNNLKIGQKYQGGIIFSLDVTGKHGKICAEKDLGEYSWEDAISACDNLSLNGFEDWHLPSFDEIKKLYQLRNVIGGFNSWYYWSNLEADNLNSWSLVFGTGTASNSVDKSTAIYVRAVREF